MTGTADPIVIENAVNDHTETEQFPPSQVRVSVGGQTTNAIPGPGADSLISWVASVNVSGLSRTVTISAEAGYEGIGKIKADSISVPISFTNPGPTLDKTITITSPRNGVTFTASDSRGITINLTGTASDNPGGSGGSRGYLG